MGKISRTSFMDGPNAVKPNFYRTIANYFNDTVSNCICMHKHFLSK